jgi:hypothetical protein
LDQYHKKAASSLMEFQQPPADLGGHCEEKQHPQKVKQLIDLAESVTGVNDGCLYNALNHVHQTHQCRQCQDGDV